MAGYTKTPVPRLRFHAVTVIAGEDACVQALALKDVRLLSAEAPRLPMRDCTRPEHCDCRFQHHDDRRAGPRRGAAHAQTTTPLPDTGERRKLRGRRATDFD
ncbi:MAG TPA: hypothetical protein VNS57_17200 [Steroidobacteraceae bacterium]|nr:hypothetical protein [Steroidobacteraceae bacterium]